MLRNPLGIMIYTDRAFDGMGEIYVQHAELFNMSEWTLGIRLHVSWQCDVLLFEAYITSATGECSRGIVEHLYHHSGVL